MTTLPREIAQLPSLMQLETREVSGIYFLCRDGNVVYVGQSKHVHRRIWSHKRKRKLFDSVYFIAVPVNDLNRVEADFILRLNPPLNIARPATPDAVVGGKQIPAVDPLVTAATISFGIRFVGANPTWMNADMIAVMGRDAVAYLHDHPISRSAAQRYTVREMIRRKVVAAARRLPAVIQSAESALCPNRRRAERPLNTRLARTSGGGE